MKINATFWPKILTHQPNRTRPSNKRKTTTTKSTKRQTIFKRNHEYVYLIENCHLKRDPFIWFIRKYMEKGKAKFKPENLKEFRHIQTERKIKSPAKRKSNEKKIWRKFAEAKRKMKMYFDPNFSKERKKFDEKVTKIEIANI